MSKNYLNVGCGSKFHKDWTNVDMASRSPHVIEHNLIEGFPFKDNQFDVVYHSQVLEHIPKNDAGGFIDECFRVLKPGGRIRVVTPDLENIVNEYLKLLDTNLNNPSDLSVANYDWIMLELLDQSVRMKSGGFMKDYLNKLELINEAYIYDRIGYVGRRMRKTAIDKKQQVQMVQTSPLRSKLAKVKQNIRTFNLRNLFLNSLLTKEEKRYLNAGGFQMGGEIHFWLYDRFSLPSLLKDRGFKDTVIMNPFNSYIADWNKFELDVKDGFPFDPTSIFVEAVKP